MLALIAGFVSSEGLQSNMAMRRDEPEAANRAPSPLPAAEDDEGYRPRTMKKPLAADLQQVRFGQN